MAIQFPTSKLPNLKPTIFTTVGILARAHNATNLSQGFPDFDADPVLLSLVTKAMIAGHNQYAPMQGYLPLRETIANKIETLYGAIYNPATEITITAGATQAIYTAITALVSTGDEVIVLKPAYDCYEPAIHLAGGTPVFISLKEKDFKIDWEEFQAAISPRTKMVIINTPHNPSGQIFSKADMLELQKSLKNTNIILLSDEVYEHIIFDGKEHQSVCRFTDLASRSIICSSFGKTFHVTGWKIGYCVAPAALMVEFQKVHQFNVFCTNNPMQIALNEYLKTDTHYVSLNSFYQEKRDFFLNAIAPSRFNFTPSQGSFFQLVDFSEITNESDILFNERLIKEYKLAGIPMSVFNVNERKTSLLRFCFAKKKETLAQAAEILNNL